MPERIHDPRPGSSRPCYGCGIRRATRGQFGFCAPYCRFWAKVALASDCWNWAGAKHNSKGYGRFDAYGVRWLAHRYAFTLLVSDIPDGLELDHLCKNTRCVNPYHLEPVSSEEHDRRTDQGAHQRARTHCPQGHEYTPENTRLSRTGGRHCRACDSPGCGLKGSNNGNSRLTETTVAEARARRACGERVGGLAVHYGVAQSVMSRALAGVTWSHVA